MHALCQKISLSQDEVNSWERGPLRLQIKRHGSDWLWLPEWTQEDNLGIVANLTDPQSLASSQMEVSLKNFLHLDPLGARGDSQWSRWAFHTPIQKFYIQPFLPDKSIVVKPRFSLTLPPNEKVHFFVNIPLFFQIHLVNENENVDIGLEKIPSVFLNKMWFGDFVEGELCYGLLTRAVRSLQEVQPLSHRAVCQIDVHNETANSILLEKICLDTSHMGIYEGQGSLCTNVVEMKINNDTPRSLIYSSQPPQQLRPCTLLTEPLKAAGSFLNTGGGVGDWIGKNFLNL